MTRSRIALFALCSVLLAGCATPPEVKQALVNLDERYAENATLMRQYRQVTKNINERFEFLFKRTRRLNYLETALLCATKSQTGQSAGLRTRLLDQEIIEAINRMRLKGLAEAPPLAKGTKTMSELVENMPALLAAIEAKADADYKQTMDVQDALVPFDTYLQDVANLKRINQVIRGYLEIDLTIKAEDAKTIAAGVRELQK